MKKQQQRTLPCRYCGRPVIIRRQAWNERARRVVYGNPFLVIHVDGCSCDGGGQLMLAF